MPARPFLQGERAHVPVLVDGDVVEEVFIRFREIFPHEGTARFLASQSALNRGCHHPDRGLDSENLKQVRVCNQRSLVKVERFSSVTDRFQFGQKAGQ